MTLPLQAVADPSTDQNFRQIAEQFPVAAGNLAKGLIFSVAGTNLKVATGLSSWTWTASTLSATKVIPHGLAAAPTFVGFTPIFEPTTVTINWRLTGTPSKTEFGCCGILSVASTTTIPFLWVALG